MAIVVGVAASGTGSGSYSGLIQTIIDTLKDETLEEFIPAMIERAEALFNRILYPLNDEAVATILTVAGEETSAFPTDFDPVGFKRLRSLYKGSDPKSVLVQYSPDDLRTRYLPDSSGQPTAFALETDAIRWGPIPNDAYSFTMSYIHRLVALSQSNQTNWLIEAHPDVYYFGTLMYAELFGWNDERSKNFAESTMEILQQINRWDAQRRKGDNHATVASCYF